MPPDQCRARLADLAESVNQRIRRVDGGDEPKARWSPRFRCG
ncbi:hypothetical protein SROCM77S_06725 [Streptomyces rochei]